MREGDRGGRGTVIEREREGQCERGTEGGEGQ